MTKFKTNIFETVLAILTLLSVIGLCVYFYDLRNPDISQDNPFKKYDYNLGIIKISIVSLFVRITFIICFLLLAIDKFKPNKKVLAIYLVAALSIGFIQWFELYYGSTFYYGEVRDKQGLMFPFLASLMVALVIWKISFSATENRDLSIKVILTGLLNIGLYLLWTQVYEPWKLWQS